MLDLKLKFQTSHSNTRDWMAPSPLKQLFWNVTYACNFRCGICFADAAGPHPDELTTDEAAAMVRRAAELDIEDIIISGGEPFLRADLPDLLALMADLGMTARIASNGSVLTDDLLGRLKRDTMVRSFQISLDTLDPTLYAQIHGTKPGMLDRALESLRLIKAHGFHTTVSVRLGPKTQPGIPALLDRALEEGWATVTIHLPLHTHRAKDAYAQDDDMLAHSLEALEHFASLPDAWLVETYVPWAPWHPAMRELGKHIAIVHRGCRAGRDRLTVNATGNMAPCVCMDTPAGHLGNVRTDDLAEVFESAPICLLMRDPAGHGICTDCEHVAVCGAGCRSAALALSGRIDGLDTSCPVRRAKADAAT